MGLQLECPVCGWSRPQDKFWYRGLLKAKEVRSLGGNDGFEHEPVRVPDRPRNRVETALSMAYEDLVLDGTFKPVSTTPVKTKISWKGVKTNVRFNPDSD